MTFLSAADDLCFRTLSMVEGGLKKLAYVASLRRGDGSYRHWGLERKHGPDAAEQAMAANHSHEWLEILRAPMPKLFSELEAMDAGERQELLAELSGSKPPDQQNGGTVQHFNSTVLALQLAFPSTSEQKAA